MLKKTKNRNRGLSIIGLLLFGFVIVLVLGYYNIRIRDVVENPTTQENLDYVEGATKSFWDKYLKDPANYLWNDVWVDIFWKGFINNMKRIRDGQPTDFDTAVPSINPL